MTRFVSPRPRAVARSLPRVTGPALLLLAAASTLACSKVTTIASDSPISISAQTPAPPLADLPAVPQPPPPPRVVLEGEVLTLDEALSFDAEGLLLAEHEDIVAEVAKWLAQNEDVVRFAVEAVSDGEGSKRTHAKRSKALAQVVVDALVREGVDAERLEAVGLGKAEDGARRVTLRVAARAESEMTIAPE